MRHFSLILATGAAVLTAGALMPSSVSATPFSAPTGLRLVLDDMNPIQDVAICFYLDGWNGPGMYDCGYRHRRGHGWRGHRDGHNDQGRMNDRGRRGDYYGRNDYDEGRGRR